MICCFLLLVVAGSIPTFSQTLVFHLTDGAKSTVTLPATFTITPTGDKLIIDGGGTVVELSKDDVICVTYRDKKGDVNGDQTVDVADIATIISIMAGKENNNGESGSTPNPETIGNTQTFTANGISFTMVYVEGGTFQMGSEDSDAASDERPVHQVQINSFSIGQTEVTQELWEAVMGTDSSANPSKWKGAKLPVEQVSWNQCQTFIAKLNQLTGKTFRFPTEAEWEFAARGGINSQGYKYAGSNNIDDVAWYRGNCSNKTHEVATKQPNEIGIYDMSGNVWEWCQDWYSNSYYSSSVINNPTGPDSGSDHVHRGGGMWDVAGGCRITDRSHFGPTVTSYNLGLRLAL